jgi:hypothetical protein
VTKRECLKWPSGVHELELAYHHGLEPPALDHLLRGYPSDHGAIVSSSTGAKPAPTPEYAPRSGDGHPSPACIAQGFRVRFLRLDVLNIAMLRRISESCFQGEWLFQCKAGRFRHLFSGELAAPETGSIPFAPLPYFKIPISEYHFKSSISSGDMYRELIRVFCHEVPQK